MNRSRLSLLVLCMHIGSLSCAAMADEPDVMRVHCINVGQGDATLIEFATGAILVDTGGELSQDFDGTEALVAYLDEFFARRTDLAGRDHPLDLLAITHPHKDHTRAIPEVVVRYPPRNVIHNGQRTGSGSEDQNFAITYIRESDADGYFILRERAVEAALATGQGLSNAVIDPINPPADLTDPIITVLWGQSRSTRGWDFDDFEDQNNHSLVIRIDFGSASMLFTGDLEEAINDQETRFDSAGIEQIVEAYQATNVLDVDVYHVGHHGSHNGTSEELLQLLTPKIAVISCGPPMPRAGEYTAFNFGHSRTVTIRELEDAVELDREAPKQVTYFDEFGGPPVGSQMHKAVYSTGWDGTIVLEAQPDGDWTVKSLAGNPDNP